MNENENKIGNLNDNDSDTKSMPTTPPDFDGDENDSDTKSMPATPPGFNGDDENENDKATDTQVVSTSGIFSFVKSLFSSVTAQFNFNNFFNFAPMQNFGQHFRPQPFERDFMPAPPHHQPQMQTFTETQEFSFSASSSKTMTLDSTGDKEVWLTSESEEVAINATSTTGTNILAGNNRDNQIFGGSGINDMWGGNGKTNDYLFGGSGQNTFWYGKGEGVDLVENTKSGDTINLYNITLGDISNVEITDSSISLVVGENEGLAVNTTDTLSPNFKLSNGESYNYNRSSEEWQKA